MLKNIIIMIAFTVGGIATQVLCQDANTLDPLIDTRVAIASDEIIIFKISSDNVAWFPEICLHCPFEDSMTIDKLLDANSIKVVIVSKQELIDNKNRNVKSGLTEDYVSKYNDLVYNYLKYMHTKQPIEEKYDDETVMEMLRAQLESLKNQGYSGIHWQFGID